MKTFLTIGLVCLFASSYAQVPTDDDDIVETSQRNPLKVYDTPAGPAKYGDPHLAESIAALADIPRPWTVPKIIAIFEKENKALQNPEDSKSDHLRVGGDTEAGRGVHLITLLAASRDPRVAVVLSNSLLNHNLPVRAAAWEGLYRYFLTDPRYHQLPPEKPERGAESLQGRVVAWLKINKEELKRFSSDSDSPSE